MKEYLSHGMGVNSTALMLLLLDEGTEFESVFIDHGGDYPETYEYLGYLLGKGYDITVIRPNVSWKGHWSNIYDYFWFHKSIPLRAFRICTDKFKIRTANRYIKPPCIVYLGYDRGEKNRSLRKKTRVKKGVTYRYPLIERHITRKACKRIILDHGLKVPRKSGCWFCPFQTKKEWRRLSFEYPALFKKAVELEERALTARGKVGLLEDGKFTLKSLIQDNKLTNYVK